MHTSELEDIIGEEEDIIDLRDYPGLRRTKANLSEVLVKLQSGDYSFTRGEKLAIRYALEDVGELYRFAGTSAGFDSESKVEESEHRQRGERALEQARALGIVGK